MVLPLDFYLRQLQNIRSQVTPVQIPNIVPEVMTPVIPQVTPGSTTTNPPVGRGSGGSSEFERFVGAILGQESGRNYSARNKDSGAAGAYQIMPGNFVNKGGWDKEALGRDISLQEFMRNPSIQDAMARYKLQQYVKNYGFAGAAAAWYGGPGVARSWAGRTNPEGAYPSIANYVNAILRRMKG